MSWQAALAMLAVVLLSDPVTFAGWQERSASLGTRKPSIEEATKLFFQKAKGYQEEAARFQVVSSVSTVAEIYASVLQRRLRQKPGSRSLVIVPWLSRGKEIHRVLQERGLRASLLSHESTEISPFDSVLVCLQRSIHLLAGCSFDVKIIDEASSRSTKTKAKVQAVPASLVGEFSFSFGTEEVDYKYSMQALAADELRSVECFALPMAAASRDERRQLLARWIQRQQHNWPGTVAMALFYCAEAAAEFTEMLKGLGVDAGCGDDGKRDGQVSGSKRVFLGEKHLVVLESLMLCLAKGQAKDFQINGLQTVVLAEPTRQPSSGKYLQHLLQDAWKEPTHRTRMLIEVLDGNGREQTVQNRMRAYSDHLTCLQLEQTPLSPQFLDLCGRSFGLSPENLHFLLEAQGRKDESEWLQSLHAWLLKHRRKPRSHMSHAADPEESRQRERLDKGYSYMRQQLFSEKDASLFKACSNLVDFMPSRRLQDLADWLAETGRLPNARSKDVKERKQARSWQAARRSLKMGKLSAADRELVEAWGSGSLGKPAPEVREWMQSLDSWLRSHGKPRWNVAQREERMQAERLQKAKEYAKAGKLNEAEEQLLSELLSELLSLPASWLQDLMAWVKRHRKKPQRGLSASQEEQKLARRWAKAEGLLKLGALKPSEEELFRETKLLVKSRPRGWVKSLYDWVAQAGRRPRESVKSEKQQATRWIQAQAYLRKGALKEEEQKLFLRCKELVAEKAETEVRDWLQSLHSWLTSHQAKPRYNASEPSEKRMAQRLKWAKKCLKAGQFNLAEQQLLQRCLILGQNGM